MFFGLEICARHIFSLAFKEMFVMFFVSSAGCVTDINLNITGNEQLD
jgi:hypothetical protein